MKIEEVWRQAFAPDSGMLLDIRVYGTSEADYRALLPFIVSHFSARYVRDGVELEVPDYDTILGDYENVSVFVKSDVSRVQVNLWFHSQEEIDLDLLPDNVDSVEKAVGIFDFMKTVAMLLHKRVLLTAENASADQEWSERHCIASVVPSDGTTEYHSDLEGWSRY